MIRRSCRPLQTAAADYCPDLSCRGSAVILTQVSGNATYGIRPEHSVRNGDVRIVFATIHFKEHGCTVGTTAHNAADNGTLVGFGGNVVDNPIRIVDAV